MTAGARSAAVGVLLAASWLGAGLASAQPPARRSTTLRAIRAFPAFFHGQAVIVRATLVEQDGRYRLEDDFDQMPVIRRPDATGGGPVDARGEVWDIGRMQPGDPRLTGRDLKAALGVDVEADWPRPGELLAFFLTGTAPSEPIAAPSVRALALAPDRYDGQEVTVAGQFRGRNLYGDLPQAPAGASGRDEFVIRAGTSAIWVTGRRPRGRGFAFDPTSKIDTKRWVEVRGTVRQGNGLAWIEGRDLREVPPEKEQVREEIVAAAAPIPPEVLFSAPTHDETDVPLTTKVRIQFSRDLDPASLPGKVRVRYLGAQAAQRGEAQPPGLEFRVTYSGAARVMEIAFSRPLERFRTVQVELTEGIVGTDGAALPPWTLTFTLGG